MATVTITQLPNSGALTGSEVLPIVQGDVTVQTTVQDVANLAGGGGIIAAGTGAGSTLRINNNNTAGGNYSTVSGGFNNTASCMSTTIGGGERNTVCGNYSSIVGGSGNTITNNISFIGGGTYNTISGNYGVIVFDGEDPFSSQVATFRMIVFENLVQINGVVNNSSSVGDRFKRQEIDFDISHAGFQINAPLRDVKVVILQNGDWSSSVRGLAPTFIKQNQLIYDYNGPNNFDGGSEWRFFEVKSLKFASIQVEGLMMEPDGWHAYLRRDPLRGGKAYQTEFDINGKFFIRNDLGEESHLDAEYIWVHFKLDSPPILDAIVELETSESRFKPELFRLEYDIKEKAYAKKILMKQGYYNYRYKLRDLYHPNGDLSVTEGNHSETENDYHIITYFFDRQFGGDRIIGVSAINSIAR
jgi:hypothetical protein